jgi:hypothetical protein
VWGWVEEVTLLINDRASSSIERWRARHYSSCAFPGRQFFHLSLLCLCTIQPALFIYSHTHTKLSLSRSLSGRKKKVTIPRTLHLRLLFIINVNVLRNPYGAQISKMILVKPFLGSRICFIWVCTFGIYSYWHVTLVITPLQYENLSSVCTDRHEISVHRSFECLHPLVKIQLQIEHKTRKKIGIQTRGFIGITSYLTNDKLIISAPVCILCHVLAGSPTYRYFFQPINGLLLSLSLHSRLKYIQTLNGWINNINGVTEVLHFKVTSSGKELIASAFF